MILRHALLAFCLGTGLAVPPATAQDVDSGREIAQRWCSGCHMVAPGVGRDGAPPSFATIAQTSGMTEAALAVFLSTPHGRMPDYSLTRREIRDVSAYILSLKR